MTNFEIIDILRQTAKYLEFLREPPEFFRQYSNAASVVSELDFPLEILTDGLNEGRKETEDEFRSIFRALDRDCRRDVQKLISTGTFEIWSDLQKELPERVKLLLTLDFPRPLQIETLRRALKIDSLEDLQLACRQNLIRAVDGFSAADEARILADVESKTRSSSHIFWANAEFVVDSIIDSVLQLDRPFASNDGDSDGGESGDRNSNASFSGRLKNSAVFSKVKSFFQKRPDQVEFDYRNNSRFPANRPPFVEPPIPPKRAGIRETPPGTFPPFPNRPVPERPFFEPREKNPSFERENNRSRRPDPSSRPWIDDPRNGNRTPAGIRENRDSDRFRSPEPLVRQIEPVGLFRQYFEWIGELEFLIETDNPFQLFDRLEKLSFVKTILRRNGNCLSIRLDGQKFLLPVGSQECPDMTVEFYAVPVNRFGAGLLYFSSSGEHWESLEEKARRKGWRLDEFGLFDGEKCLAARTEEKIYRRFELPWIPPEIRTNRRDEEWIENGSPRLLELEDIRGDLHMHTTHTDGTGSIEEMVRKALSLGLRYIALTDHSKNVVVAGGMGTSAALRYWEAIDEANDRLRRTQTDFHILKGMEVDILEEGGLDFDDDVLSQADWIIASIHFGLDQSRRRIHERYLSAMQNPFVKVIAHPTDRVLGIRGSIDVDLDFLCEEAKRYGKFLEINSQPKRLDLNEENARKAAIQYGVPLVISTDSHAVDQMDYLRFGVRQARRAGLTAKNIVNALSFDDFQKLIDPKTNVGTTL